MRAIAFCNGNSARRTLRLLGLLLALLTPAAVTASGLGESLSGFYAREGNDGSPAQTAGNNIYIHFYPDRWLGMLFLPYPYASRVDAAAIARVFERGRAQTDSAAYLRGSFGELEQKATLHIERYGYIEDRIIYECGSLAPCTIRLGDGYLDLIKPGVINEHIIRYNQVAVD